MFSSESTYVWLPCWTGYRSNEYSMCGYLWLGPQSGYVWLHCSSSMTTEEWNTHDDDNANCILCPILIPAHKIKPYAWWTVISCQGMIISNLITNSLNKLYTGLYDTKNSLWRLSTKFQLNDVWIKKMQQLLRSKAKSQNIYRFYMSQKKYNIRTNNPYTTQSQT